MRYPLVAAPESNDTIADNTATSAAAGGVYNAGTMTMLNTIVAESLDVIATQLEKSVQSGKDLNKAVQELLPGIIKESKKVLFNGDNYTAEWHAEAEKRGLPNLPSCVEALPLLGSKEATALFDKYGVLTERELQSRLMILCEHYIKTVAIEGRCMSMMARTMILPAALRYQAEVAQAMSALQAAGAKVPGRETELLNKLTGLIDDLQVATDKVDRALAHHADGDAMSHAKYARDHVVAAMAELRKAGDALETVVADDLWPLPTYREMLFMK